MNTLQKGSASLIGIVAVLLLLAAGGYWYISQPTEQDAMTENDSMMMDEKDGDSMMEDEGSMMEDKDAMMDGDGAMMMEGYSGTVLAGKSSPLLDFTPADYEAAKKSGKLIVLYFYANWCPTCKAELPHLYGAFDDLTGDDVIGFRVNYNDSDTEKAETDLAREFGVAYQHTKVFLKNGERVLKSPETWNQARYESEIANAK